MKPKAPRRLVGAAGACRQPSCGPQRCANFLTVAVGRLCNCRKGSTCGAVEVAEAVMPPCGRRSSAGRRIFLGGQVAADPPGAMVDHEAMLSKRRRADRLHSSMGSQARAGSIAIIICGGIADRAARPIVS